VNGQTHPTPAGSVMDIGSDASSKAVRTSGLFRDPYNAHDKLRAVLARGVRKHDA
jgi:ribosome-associated translation inhibitor RaiA